MRRDPGVEAVAVVLEVLAEVVGVVVEAEDAVSARHVGGGHDAVAAPQRPALAVWDGIGPADRLDHADVLVAADERVDDVAFVVGSRVLL